MKTFLSSVLLLTGCGADLVIGETEFYWRGNVSKSFIEALEVEVPAMQETIPGDDFWDLRVVISGEKPEKGPPCKWRVEGLIVVVVDSPRPSETHLPHEFAHEIVYEKFGWDETAKHGDIFWITERFLSSSARTAGMRALND